MDGGDIVGVMFGLLLLGIIGLMVFAIARSARPGAKGRERGEALFKSMFPDLQPHFHPKNVLAFVRARRASGAPRGARTWRKPPGFAAAEGAEISFPKDRETVRLLDAAGNVLGQFIFEEHAEGGVLRVGKGKFTVNTQNPAQPRVRYWHPDREFKWKNGAWTFESRMSEDSIESSSDSSSSFSDRSSSSSHSTAATAAAATAGIVAAGGAFDGGGASQSWVGGRDDDSSSSSSSSSSDVVVTAY